MPQFLDFEPPDSVRKHSIGFHHLWAALAGGGYAFVIEAFKHPALLTDVDETTRSVLYASLAATSGALLGFAITGVTVLLTIGSGRRMEWLYQQDEFKYVRTIFLGAIGALALGAIWFSVLIVADREDAGKGALEAIGTYVLFLMLLRLWALVRLLGDLLAVALRDRQDDRHQEANPGFTEPLDDI